MRRRPSASETDDDEALRAYVLYPYLRAARIERALARAQGAWHETDARPPAFLAEAGDAPVARRLRRAWLASLARRASWQAFLEHYDAAAATPALECQQFNARIARRGDRGARRRDPRALAHGLSAAERMRARVPMAASAGRAARRARRGARGAAARQRSSGVRARRRGAAAARSGRAAARARRLHREPRAHARRAGSRSEPRRSCRRSCSRRGRGSRATRPMRRSRATPRCVERVPTREGARRARVAAREGSRLGPQAGGARLLRARAGRRARRRRPRVVGARGDVERRLGRGPRGDRGDVARSSRPTGRGAIGRRAPPSSAAKRTRRARSITAALARRQLLLGHGGGAARRARRPARSSRYRSMPPQSSRSPPRTRSGACASSCSSACASSRRTNGITAMRCCRRPQRLQADPSRRALGDLRRRRRDGDEPGPLQRLHAALSAAATPTRSRRP